MTSVIQPHNMPVMHNTHPTLLVLYGDVYEVRPLVQRIHNRLRAFVDAGVVQTVIVESGDDIQLVMLPEYDAWLGFDNPYRYSATNEDKWSNLAVDVSQMNVLVVSLDPLVDGADLQALYQHISQQYVGRGINTIPTALLWHTENPVPTKNMNYAPQIYVHPRRVRDAVTTIEHAVVNWVTADLLAYVDQRIVDIQAKHKNKQIKAIWLGAAGIYVDETYSIRAFFERMVMMFLQAWRTPALDLRTEEELRRLSQQEATNYVAKVYQTIQQTLQQRDWRLRSNHAHQFEQTGVNAQQVSGIPAAGTEVAKSVFGDASSWWLGENQDENSFTIVRSLVRRFGLLFVQSHEVLLPMRDEIEQGLVRHYRSIHIDCQSAMSRLHDGVYAELEQFFVRQLVDLRNESSGVYGLKRMITVMEKYISQLETTPRMSIHNQYLDKLIPVPLMSSLNDDDLASYARAHAQHLHFTKQKWMRAYASLMSLSGMGMRLLVTYPMILSVIYAIRPDLYMQDFARTALILAVVMVLGGVGYVTTAYYAYYSDIEKDRDAFFAESMTPLVLSIAAYWSNLHREQLLARLRRLCVVYQDIESKVQQSHMYVPVSIENTNTPACFVVRRLDRVFGTKHELVDGRFKGLPWDAVRNEMVWCYVAEQQLWLSWVSEIKAHLNQVGEYRAEVTMLQQMVANVFKQRREAASGIVYLEEQISKYIPELKKRDPIALEVLIEDVAELQSGKKWPWLQQNAQVDVVPRNTTGMQVEKSTIVVLSTQGMEALVGLTGQGNPLYRPVDAILTTRLPNEMSRFEFEFDVK